MVVCFNLWDSLTEPFLRTFFEHIGADFQYEFWFVDNGSIDGTQEKAQELIPNLVTQNCVGFQYHFWDSRGQEGVMPKARNTVYPLTVGERVILFNNDILFHKTGWLNILDAAMTPDVGMAGQDWMQETCVPFIGGGWDCIPRRVHDEIIKSRGYFSDEQFSLVADDVDLSGMVQKLRYKIERIPELKNTYIEHLLHKTMDAFISIPEQTQRAAKDRALIKRRCQTGYYENTDPSSSLH